MTTLKVSSKLLKVLANAIGCQVCEFSGSTLGSVLRLAESYGVSVRWDSFTGEQLNTLIY